MTTTEDFERRVNDHLRDVATEASENRLVVSIGALLILEDMADDMREALGPSFDPSKGAIPALSLLMAEAIARAHRDVSDAAV